MAQSTATAAALAAELQTLLPAELHTRVPALAEMLADVAGGSLSPEAAAVRLAAPEFAEILGQLNGKSLEPNGAALTFSGDTITVSNISNSEAMAVGRGAIAIKLGIYMAEQAYNVQGLRNPYLGLAAFTYAERARFAGRARYTTRALGLLTSPGKQLTLLFVNGASGSGKSSFAQAGLVPALEQHYRARNLEVRRAVMRPGTQPLAALADGLQQLGLPPDPSFAAAQPFMIGVASSAPDQQTIGLLVIDQFEELFSSQCDVPQRDAFLAILAGLPAFPQLRMHLIATLRSDFLPELFERAALYEIAKQGIDLRAMTVDELKEAIQRPLQQMHPDKRVELALLDRLAIDAADDAAFLPLLQVTLDDLWRRGSLTLAAYGTLTDAIRRRANSVYSFSDYDGACAAPRPASERDAILSMFLDLVEVSLADDPRHDVRQQRTRAALTRGDTRRDQLVTDLTTARLLSTGLERQGEADVEIVNIIHESLIVNWDQLRQAIAEERDALQQRVRFEQALAEWQEHQRADDYLMTGVRLAEAEALQQRGDVALQGVAAQAFYTQSVRRRDAERQRRLKQARLVALGLGVLALVALVAAGFAVNRQQLADSQRATAVAEQQRANAQAVTAVAEGQRADSQRATAVAEGARADTQAAAAKTQEAIAVRNEQQARLEQRIARTRELASGAISNLAVDPELSVLLASAAISETQAISAISVPEAQEALQQAVQAARVRQILTGHTKGVTRLAFGPDGRLLATASNDGTVRRWDLTTGRTLRSFTGIADVVLGLALSSDGTRLAAAGGDGTVILWEMASGTELMSIPAHDGAATSVAFSPAGARLATAGDDGTAKVWDAASGAALLTIPAHDGAANSVAFSPDGRLLVTAGDDETAKVWDVDTGKELRALEGHSDRVEDAAFSPNGKLLATASDDGTARLWDAETGALLRTVAGHANNVYAVAFSADGRYLATGGADGTARLWDAVSGQQLLILAGHSGGVSDVAFSPDGTQLATASFSPDNTARIWSLAFVHPNRPTYVAFDPAGDHLVSASLDGAHIWDVATGQELRVVDGHAEGTLGVAFSPDGKLLATAGFDGTAKLWDAATGTPIRTFSGHTGAVGRVVFSPDGALLATASDDGTARLWNVTTGESRELRHTEGELSYVYGLAFSPDGKQLATASFENAPTLKIWDVATGAELRTISGTAELNSVAWSPDGTRLAAGDEAGVAHVWDAATGQELWSVRHPPPVTAVAFSPDGALLATASNDKTVKLWETQAGQQQLALPHPAEIYSLAFSADGKRLATASADNVVRVFPLDPGELLALARQRTIRQPNGEECRRYRLTGPCGVGL